MPAARQTQHPHLEQPSKKAIREALADRPVPIRSLYLDVHDLVREVAPGIAFELDLSDQMMGYARHQFGYGGWGGLALACHSKWVSLGFLRGSELADPQGILEGTGKKARHVKLRTTEDLEARRAAFAALIAEATASQ